MLYYLSFHHKIISFILNNKSLDNSLFCGLSKEQKHKFLSTYFLNLSRNFPYFWTITFITVLKNAPQFVLSWSRPMNSSLEYRVSARYSHTNTLWKYFFLSGIKYTWEQVNFINWVLDILCYILRILIVHSIYLYFN